MRCYRIILVGVIALAVIGCGGAPKPQQETTSTQEVPQFTPYVPSSRPALPEVTDALPDSPRDAPPDLKLVYSVEIWQLLLPRNAVSSDETFWKRVNESAIDLSPYTIMFKNGVRVGSMPLRDLPVVQALVDDRKANLTRTAGIAGKFIELSMQNDIPQQTLFYFNRSNQLIGRWYDRSENLFYFSFEPTPRKQDHLRMVLTPAVRGLNKRLVYSLVPGKTEKEVSYKTEEVQYDASLNLDLPLGSVLIVAPSVEARDAMTIGGSFLIRKTPTEELERLIVIIPQAYTRNDSPERASK